LSPNSVHIPAQVAQAPSLVSALLAADQGAVPASIERASRTSVGRVRRDRDTYKDGPYRDAGKIARAVVPKGYQRVKWKF
jgi:phage terminase large subunit-like protein